MVILSPVLQAKKTARIPGESISGGNLTYLNSYIQEENLLNCLGECPVVLGSGKKKGGRFFTALGQRRGERRAPRYVRTNDGGEKQRRP